MEEAVLYDADTANRLLDAHWELYDAAVQLVPPPTPPGKPGNGLTMKTNLIEYWQHDKSGEIFAVRPDLGVCFGPIHYEEIGGVGIGDERFSAVDYLWLQSEPCKILEL